VPDLQTVKVSATLFGVGGGLGDGVPLLKEKAYWGRVGECRIAPVGFTMFPVEMNG
jgi:hypothetical protein